MFLNFYFIWKNKSRLKLIFEIGLIFYFFYQFNANFGFEVFIFLFQVFSVQNKFVFFFLDLAVKT